jgi:mycothiol synthase
MLTFEGFMKWFESFMNWYEGPDLLEEATLVLMRGGQWCALSELRVSLAKPDLLTQAFTAVAPELRGKGIATLLKLKNIVWAKANIITQNNTLNAPMLKANDKLGFVRLPAKIQFKKTL